MLQLGFDKAVKLTSYDDAALREVLALTASDYGRMAESLDTDGSDASVYWRIQFAILTVHSPLDASLEAYRRVRLYKARYGRLPGQAKLAGLLLAARANDGVVQYCGQKARYLKAFDAAWRSDRTVFLRGFDGDDAYRLRLQKNVLGLGLAKASFAVALMSPSTSDVCCIDTHMYQIFAGSVPKGSVAKRVYYEIEERIRGIRSRVRY